MDLSLNQTGDGFLAHQRAIAVQDHQQTAGRLQLAAAAEDAAVSGTFLLGLMNETDATVSDGLLDQPGLMSDHHEDPVLPAALPSAPRRRQYDPPGYPRRRAVQDLRLARFHAGPQTRRKNHY